MVATSQTEVDVALRGGVVAGAAGAGVLALVMLALTTVRGEDPWSGAKFAAAPWLGGRVFDPGFDPVALTVGLATHLGVSIIWGMLFGLVVFGFSKHVTITAGAMFGFLVWLVMFYAVLPLLGLARITLGIPPWIAIFEHVVYGVVLALVFNRYQPID